MKKATAILNILTGAVLIAAGILGLIQACTERSSDDTSSSSGIFEAEPPRAVFVIQCSLERAIAQSGSPSTTKARTSKLPLSTNS